MLPKRYLAFFFFLNHRRVLCRGVTRPDLSFKKASRLHEEQTPGQTNGSRQTSLKLVKEVWANISVAVTARMVVTCAVKNKQINRSDSGYVLTGEPRGRIRPASGW